MFWPPVCVWCFGGFFIWVVYLLAGDRPIVFPVPSAFMCVPCIEKCFVSVEEVRVLQIDFSAAIDRVNHQVILNKLCSVGILGYEWGNWKSLYQISHDTLWLTVVGVNCWTLCLECQMEMFWAYYRSYCTYQSVFPYCCLNNLIGYADLWTLFSVVPSPCVRITSSCGVRGA